jgi:glyoxylase-like metal-dependent hydrolase (beta-lactamase superfamily II)
MKVERLNVGWMTAPAGLWRQGEEEPERPLRLPVPAYLIETEAERILVDTGLHPAAAADAEAHYEGSRSLGFFALEQEESIAAQVDLDTVTKVVLTHLHFDHAGGLELIPKRVPVAIQRAEWQAGKDRAAIERNFFQPRDYAGEHELVFVDGDHDLLGDGSVQLLSTPGHTPGHQSVRVGSLLLGIDVAHFANGLDEQRFPSFADDFEAQARSAVRLRELRESGLAFQPGHDPDVLRPGPLAV